MPVKKRRQRPVAPQIITRPQLEPVPDLTLRDCPSLRCVHATVLRRAQVRSSDGWHDLRYITGEILRCLQAVRDGYDTPDGHSSSMGYPGGPELCAAELEGKLKSCAIHVATRYECIEKVGTLADGIRSKAVAVWHPPDPDERVPIHLLPESALVGA